MQGLLYIINRQNTQSNIMKHSIYRTFKKSKQMALTTHTHQSPLCVCVLFVCVHLHVECVCLCAHILFTIKLLIIMAPKHGGRGGGGGGGHPRAPFVCSLSVQVELVWRLGEERESCEGLQGEGPWHKSVCVCVCVCVCV